MPIYEYRCEGCGKVYEHLIIPRDKKLPRYCDACDNPLIKIPSSFHIRVGMVERENFEKNVLDFALKYTTKLN